MNKYRFYLVFSITSPSFRCPFICNAYYGTNKKVIDEEAILDMERRLESRVPQTARSDPERIITVLNWRRLPDPAEPEENRSTIKSSISIISAFMTDEDKHECNATRVGRAS